MTNCTRTFSEMAEQRDHGEHLRQLRYYVVCDHLTMNTFLDDSDEEQPYRFGPLSEKQATERLETLSRPGARCPGPHHIEEVNE